MARARELARVFSLRLNRQGPVARAMAGDSYTVYVIHPVVLILISIGFAGLALPPLAKFAIVLQLSLVLVCARSHNPGCARGNEGAMRGSVFSYPE